jgi:hypothetical protein
MRPGTHLQLLSAVLLGACGSDGPEAFDHEEFIGVWEVSIPKTTGCWDAFALRFEVEPDDAEGETEGLVDIVSTWWIVGGPAATELFTGHFRWGDSPEFEFVFHLLGSTSLQMEGSETNPAHVTGTFRDRDPVVFPADCSAVATATHLSPTDTSRSAQPQTSTTGVVPSQAPRSGQALEIGLMRLRNVR